MLRRFTILIFALLPACSLLAQDESPLPLRQVSMSLMTEPTYFGTPRYTLVVIGKDLAKQHWIAIDDKNAYVDKNGNGDLTDEGEAIPIDKTPVDSGPNHEFRMQNFRIGMVAGHKLNLWVWRENSDFKPDRLENALLTEWRKERVKHGLVCATIYRNLEAHAQQMPIVFSPKKEHSQITQIDGDLTCDIVLNEMTLLRDSDNRLNVHVGTLGVRAKNSRFFPSFARLSLTEIPDKIAPIATLKFDNENDKENKIEIELNLSTRVRRDTFTAPISIPENAKDGTVEVEIRIPAWDGHTVLPRKLTLELKSKSA